MHGHRGCHLKTPPSLTHPHNCSQGKQGKSSLKAGFTPCAPAQTFACIQMCCPIHATPYCPKYKGRRAGKVCSPNNQQGLHCRVCVMDVRLNISSLTKYDKSSYFVKGTSYGICLQGWHCPCFPLPRQGQQPERGTESNHVLYSCNSLPATCLLLVVAQVRFWYSQGKQISPASPRGKENQGEGRSLAGSGGNFPPSQQSGHRQCSRASRGFGGSHQFDAFSLMTVC